MIRSTILLGTLLWSGITTPVTFGQATPTPDAPPPELCRAAPRSFGEMTPRSPPETTPEPTSTIGPEPGRTPADPETVAGITATVREFVACLNAGEWLRALGLYTDSGLFSFLVRQYAISREDYEALATPVPAPPDDQFRIREILGVRELPFDRVFAVVVLDFPEDPSPNWLSFTFVKQNGRWLIDGIGGRLPFSWS
jgi:hypothetical protein